MTKTIVRTAGERAKVQVDEARAEAAKEGGGLLAKAMELMDNSADLHVAAVNAAREAGQRFNVASGREQLVFTVEGMSFARTHILPHLPAGCDLRHVRLAVHLAQILPEPLRSREELPQVKHELQQLLAVSGLGEAPHRRELQSAHARNLFSDFVSGAGGMRKLIEQLEKEEPMEEWPQTKLDEFLVSVKPIRERITLAERLMLGR
jgi:hypothetical protein